MHDLKMQREKLRLNAADCELIVSLATDPKKRETFRHLCVQLNKLIADLDAEIAAREAKDTAA